MGSFSFPIYFHLIYICCRLDQMYRFRDTTKNVLDGTFLIKKQPTGDRYKWRLAMWYISFIFFFFFYTFFRIIYTLFQFFDIIIFRNESSPEDLKDYRRIWFEIRAPAAKIVLLSVCLNFNQILFEFTLKI